MLRPILLKLSGEALRGTADGIFDRHELMRVAQELLSGIDNGARVGIVVGGGNILRGDGISGDKGDPTRGHYMGMLATLINSLALKEVIEDAGGDCEVVAPHNIPNVAHQYNRAQVVRWLDEGVVVVFGGGTGHPFFTTDTTAALRAAEIGADCLLKASNVDGIYTADPRKDSSAKRFETLSFDEAIAGRYQVMDQAAFAICRDQSVSIRVFDMRQPGAIVQALGPTPPGTLVGS